jgi:Uma2 family endonuclease
VTCAPSEGAAYFDRPRLLVEILSRSTAREDRTAKLDFYKSLPSAQAVLFVWQDTRRAELHLRREDGWLVTDTIKQGRVEVAGLGLALTLDDIYAELD